MTKEHDHRLPEADMIEGEEKNPMVEQLTSATQIPVPERHILLDPPHLSQLDRETGIKIDEEKLRPVGEQQYGLLDVDELLAWVDGGPEEEKQERAYKTLLMAREALVQFIGRTVGDIAAGMNKDLVKLKAGDTSVQARFNRDAVALRLTLREVNHSNQVLDHLLTRFDELGLLDPENLRVNDHLVGATEAQIRELWGKNMMVFAEFLKSTQELLDRNITDLSNPELVKLSADPDLRKFTSELNDLL